jgi:hypothetical protein
MAAKKKKKTAAPAAPKKRKAAAVKVKATAPARKKPSAAAAPALKKRKAAAAKPAIEISEYFPHELLREHSKWICLACILDIFTRHLGMSVSAAMKLIRAHKPGVDELNMPTNSRPYFEGPDAEGNCPNCHSPAKWQARLRVFRVEGGKATDKARRALLATLPTSRGQYEFLDQKSTGRDAFYQWLEHAGHEFDFEDPHALLAATKLYLERRRPDVDWDAEFSGVHAVRRLRGAEDDWKKEGARLYLSAMLFDEVLAIQYLLSRSQKSGGITFEGRKTVQELVSRLRHSGFLRSIGVRSTEPGDVLEQLLDHLSGGDAALKFHYILDRRDFLDKIALVKSARIPKLKLGA